MELQISQQAISETCRLVALNPRRRFELNKIGSDDEATFGLLRSGETYGVFLLGSLGIRDFLQRVGPTGFSELMAVHALYRPPPIAAGIDDEYVAARPNTEPLCRSWPELTHLFQETRGILLYDEQGEEVIRRLTGCSLAEAALTYHRIGELNETTPAAVATALRDDILNSRVLSAEDAWTVWNRLARYGPYTFSRAKAEAHAWISYKMAYLKQHFPVQFMAGLMTAHLHATKGADKFIALDVVECERMEIGVDLTTENRQDRFVTDGRVIRRPGLDENPDGHGDHSKHD